MARRVYNVLKNYDLDYKVEIGCGNDEFFEIIRWCEDDSRPGIFSTNGPVFALISIPAVNPRAIFYFSDARLAMEFKMRWV